MNILALDLGGTTGWAHRLHFKEGPIFHSGTQKWEPRNACGRFSRYLDVREWLDGWIEDPIELPNLIAYEKPFLRGGSANDAIIGYEHEVRVFAHSNGIELYSVRPNRLKKLITGHGHASKETMKAAVGQAFENVESKGDDEVDALAVMLAALYITGLDLPNGFQIHEYDSKARTKRKRARKRPRKKRGRNKGLFD